MIARVVPAVRLPLKAGGIYDYLVPQNLASAIVPGSVVCIPFAGRETAGLVVGLVDRSTHDKPLREIAGIVTGLNPLPAYLPTLWARLAAMFATSFPRFLWAALPSIPQRSIFREHISGSIPITPTISRPRKTGRQNVICVTSQATLPEQVIEFVRSAGEGQCLILVPTVSDVGTWVRLLGAAGTSATEYHSGLSTGDKFRISVGTNDGTVQCVIGTKSAVFLPFGNLESIIILQAGSSSHLQEDSDPRFDARIIARELALASGSQLSVFDPLPPIGMSGSVNDAVIPEVVIHDLHDAAKRARSKVLITEPVLAAIAHAIQANGRALLLLNRRGISQSLVCSDCGTAVACPSCQIPLVAHDAEMSCYACELPYPLPTRCARCGGSDYKRVGTGSKALAKFMQDSFGEILVTHVDRETETKVPDSARIVVGTTAMFRVLAPGTRQFDVVVDALMGAGTAKSGYASVEETARILRTLASYGAPDGSLHIQTFDPTSTALQSLKTPSTFIENELLERTGLGYPPARILLSLLGSSKDETVLWNEAIALHARVLTTSPAATVLEPSWGRPKRFRGLFRVSLTTKWQDSQGFGNLVSSLPAGWSAEARFL